MGILGIVERHQHSAPGGPRTKGHVETAIRPWTAKVADLICRHGSHCADALPGKHGTGRLHPDTVNANRRGGYPDEDSEEDQARRGHEPTGVGTQRGPVGGAQHRGDAYRQQPYPPARQKPLMVTGTSGVHG